MIYVESVESLWKHRAEMYIPHKRGRLAPFYGAFHEIIANVHTGYEYTNHTARHTDYWKYITSYHPSWREVPLSRKAYRGLCKKFFDGINLYHDIKANGMRDPLEMHIVKGKRVLYAGMRRLVIAHVLGIPTVKYDLIDKDKL